uniref:Uncharacterized protein n=1 Tax=Arundo donax TaxID=35708 RepID=A0A0A9CUP8_ARUDO
MVAGEAGSVRAGVAVEDADDGAEGRGGLEAALVLEHLVRLGDGDGDVARVAAREIAPPEEAVAALRVGGGVPRCGGGGAGGRRGGPDPAARREEPEERAQHDPATSPIGASPRRRRKAGRAGGGGGGGGGGTRAWFGGRAMGRRVPEEVAISRVREE